MKPILKIEMPDSNWNAISVFFNTDEIHTYNQGLVTRIYSDKRYLPWGLGL